MRNFVLALVVALMCAMFSPPSGRPPIGPLERYEPKLYDFTFSVTLSTVEQVYAPDRQSYVLENAPIVMPIIFLGTFSRVNSDSVFAKLWLDGREDKSVRDRMEIKSDFPQHTHMASFSVQNFQGQTLRWQVGYRVQMWSSRIHDADAAALHWPDKWPDEVGDGLKPQKYIESDNEQIRALAEKWTNGRVKSVPPYIAAKALVQECIGAIQVTGDGVDRGQHGINRGLEVIGASKSLQTGRGSAHDLVCACVAVLRAVNIPARPVIGVFENQEKENREDFVSWAEFYLDGAGWIPFDPDELRGKGVKNLDVYKPWPEFGTLKDLNRRIPLAYHFIPPTHVQTPRNPAIWGWDPRPGGDTGSEQNIQMDIISRGKGVEDPK